MKSFILFVVCSIVAVTFGQQFMEVDKNHDKKIDFKEFQVLFDFYDTDGDGGVTLTEVITVSHLTRDKAAAIFNQYDTNKDGKVDISELRNIFNKMDIDGSGSLSKTEYQGLNTNIVG